MTSKKNNIFNAVPPFFLAFSLAMLSPANGTAQTWLQANPGGGLPLPRTDHSAVFDSATQQMVVFAGTASPNGEPTNEVDVNDVWVLQQGGGQWRKVNPSGNSPSPRDSHNAVYDPTTDSMTIFGGKNLLTCFGDTWTLRGATGANPAWTQVASAGQTPAARFGATAVYDPVSNKMIVFGGRSCGGGAPIFKDVWILSHANGTGGTPTWTQTTPASSPDQLIRSFHSAVFDPQTNRMIVFGGSDAHGNSLNDVWVLANANGQNGPSTWSQLTPGGTLPAAREAHTAVYDPKLDRMTILGGSATAALFNDAWVLYNANGLGATPVWVKLSFTGPMPEARGAATAVYDSNSGIATLFGGDAQLFLNDVWTLQNAVGIGTTTYDGGRPGDRRLVGDFDGDGKDDFVVWRPSTATWYITPSHGGAPIVQQWGLPGDIPVPADWDNDGKTDFAVWRPSNGTWFILGSTKTGNYPFATMQQQWGLPGDIPMVGDFTGDGKIDYTVFRPSNQNWFVLSQTATKTYPAPTIQHQWGLPGDVPLAGDFDGDGRTDFTVFRPSNGTWFALSPGKLGTYPFPTVQQQWGLPGDIPVVGDFDGDGRADFTVWRPSIGNWFVLSSAHTGTYPFPTMQQQWGLAGDVPVVGDFNGDHKADLTVWRPSGGYWFVLTSGGPNHYPNPNIFQQQGQAGDVPF